MPRLRKKLGGVTDRTVYYWLKAGRLPSPIKIGSSRVTLWMERDIDDWIAKKDTARKSRPSSTMKYQLIRMPELLKRLGGVTDRTVYNWIKCRDFPAPIKFGRRVVLWIESDVDAWLKGQSGAAK